jgi:hypothetical protein
MIHPGLRQEAERIPAGMIWLVGLAGVTVSALLVAIAWWLVVLPRPAVHPPAQPPPPLERRRFDRSTGAPRLERHEWVDRQVREVCIPEVAR